MIESSAELLVLKQYDDNLLHTFYLSGENELKQKTIFNEVSSF